MKTITTAIMIALMTTLAIAQQTNVLDTVRQSFEMQQQAISAQYGKKLGAIMDDAKRAGDLDKLLMIQDEQKRFNTEKTVPLPADAKDVFLPASKAYYRTMADLLTRYVSTLDQLIKEQVRASKIEEAKALKAEKDSVSVLLADMQTKLPEKEISINPWARPHPAQEWNVVKDFNTSINPSGAWSYGWSSKLGSTFNILKNNNNRTVWNDGAAQIWKNKERVVKYGINPGQVCIHPWNGNIHSIIRWTALHLKTGQSQTVTVDGVFGTGDSGRMSVYVLHNGEELFSVLNAAQAEKFSLQVKVGPSDTIDFVVGPGSAGHSYGSTPLDVTIKSK